MAYRSSVNVSRYLRNLNVQEPAVEDTFMSEEDLAKDLALFTNTQFFDFETGQNTDYQAPPTKPDTAPASTSTDDATPTDPLLGDFSSSLDFISSDFSFGDFGSTYASPTIPSFPESGHLASLQPIQPGPAQAAYPHPSPVAQQHQAGPGYVPSVVVVPHVPVTGEKRKAEPSDSGRMLSFEDASRLAAEEDKRKRNTAASARFRIKKKQREQALEKSAKDMNDKVNALESRIAALETENKWLKSLVTEKHGGKDDILKKLLKEFSAQGAAKAGGSRSNSSSGSSSSDDGRDSVSGSSTAADDSLDSKKPSKR